MNNIIKVGIYDNIKDYQDIQLLYNKFLLLSQILKNKKIVLYRNSKVLPTYRFIFIYSIFFKLTFQILRWTYIF